MSDEKARIKREHFRRPESCGLFIRGVLGRRSSRHFPMEIISILKAGPLVKYTPFTPGSIKDLFKKVEDIRRRGYAVSIQERTLYTSGLAAPIFEHQSVIGSLGILGPKERVEATGIDHLGQIVRTIAGKVSQELGFTGERRRRYKEDYRAAMIVRKQTRN